MMGSPVRVRASALGFRGLARPVYSESVQCEARSCALRAVCDRPDRTQEVDGSNPSEGFTKGQLMAFFAASTAYAHRSSVLQLVPKICPQHLRSPGVWFEQRRLTSSSTSLDGR